MSGEYRFRYGNFLHPACEVYPKRIAVQPLFSDRGIRWGSRVSMRIAGDLVQVGATELTPAEIQTRMNQIEAAYANDYQNAGFELDGAWSSHYLLTNSANNLSGNKIVYRSWENALPTELANTRSFEVEIQATFADAYSDIFHFSETTTKVGSGGPMWRIYPRWNLAPVKVQTTLNSPVRHVTSGRIVSATGFLSPPAPYWPNEEQEWRRRITYVGPRNHGHPSGRFTHYEVRYQYSFLRLGPDPMTNFNTWYVGS